MNLEALSPFLRGVLVNAAAEEIRRTRASMDTPTPPPPQKRKSRQRAGKQRGLRVYVCSLGLLEHRFISENGIL